MVVHKVLNNNIVSSMDDRNREVLLMGRGLGWKVKTGDPVDRTKIEKIFRMDSQVETDKLKQLFLEVPVEVIELAASIVDYARSKLKKKLNKNVYITLTDHISFAIERMEQGILQCNALQWETRKLYPVEFAVGEHALCMLRERLGVELPQGEAASIALHIVNAEYDCNMQHTMEMTKIIQSSLNIVRYSFHMEFDEDSLDYQRFTTHLLYFAQRMLDGKLMHGEPDELFLLMQERCPKAYHCALQIQTFIAQRYQEELSAEELLFLIVHIQRVTAHKQ